MRFFRALGLRPAPPPLECLGDGRLASVLISPEVDNKNNQTLLSITVKNVSCGRVRVQVIATDDGVVEFGQLARWDCTYLVEDQRVEPCPPPKEVKLNWVQRTQPSAPIQVRINIVRLNEQDRPLDRCHRDRQLFARRP